MPKYQVLLCVWFAMQATYYDTLKVAQKASQPEITKAYRMHARNLHPDRNPSKNATKEFQELGRAYEILNDPERRAEYDAFLQDERNIDSNKCICLVELIKWIESLFSP